MSHEVHKPGRLEKLATKIALITGGSRGTGAPIALRLASEGDVAASHASVLSEDAAQELLCSVAASHPDTRGARWVHDGLYTPLSNSQD